MSNVIDNYYDRRIHFEEIIETDGSTLDPNPIRSIEVDILALVLFWNATGIAPTSEEGGSKYNYWCNIIREHTRRSYEYEPRYSSPQVRAFANYNSNSDMDWNKEIMTPRKQDIEYASEIIDYYKLKLSHRALTSDIPFSEYETKLSSFVNSGRKQFKFDELGVIARLEETYNVDLVFDGFIETYDSLPPEELFDSTTTNVRLRNLESIKEWKRKPLTLNFIKKLDVLGNKEQNIRYYFECNKELYCMMFAERNPLLHVLDKRIEDNNNVLNILGAVNHRPLYANSNFWYNTIYDNWILKD